MVDQAELFEVADEIVAEGRIPTVHSVRAELSKGGSMRDVGPLFKEWCLSRGFRLRPTREDVPQALQDSLIKAAAEIWAHGRDQGRAMKLNEHAEAIEKLRVMELAYVAAKARVEALEERFGIVSGGESGNSPGPGRRLDAVAFWDGLLRKIAERMGRQHINPDLAYRLLEDAEHLEAEAWAKPKTWSAAILGDKMKGRAGKGRVFQLVGENLYRAIGAGDEIKRDEPEHPEAPASRQVSLNAKSRASTTPTQAASSQGSAPFPTVIEPPSGSGAGDPNPQSLSPASSPRPRTGLRGLSSITVDSENDGYAPEERASMGVGVNYEELAARDLYLKGQPDG